MVVLYMFKLWRLGVLRAFLLARLSIVHLSAIPTYTRIYGTTNSIFRRNGGGLSAVGGYFERMGTRAKYAKAPLFLMNYRVAGRANKRVGPRCLVLPSTGVWGCWGGLVHVPVKRYGTGRQGLRKQKKEKSVCAVQIIPPLF